MIFARPWWLLALPVLAAGSGLFWIYARRLARRRLARFVSAGSLADAMPPVDRGLRAVKFAIPVMAAALVAVALARPLTGPKAGHAERKGVDFVIALDVSKSMWAEDIAPNRLDAVKKELDGWLREASGDRVGLVVFAGDAVVQAPVTFDYPTVGRILDGASPRSISKGGTDIPKAIELACDLLDKAGLDTRALVIFSDGENLEGDAVGAAREAHTKKGLTITTVGVGATSGERVPVMDRAEFEKQPAGRRALRTYTRSEYGTEVVSRLDEHALQEIAAAGGGTYQKFVPDAGFFRKLRESALLPLSKKREILNVRDYNEWFQLPLALAILILIVQPFITPVKRRPRDAHVGVAVIRPQNLSGPDAAPARASGPHIEIASALLLLLLAAQPLQAANPPALNDHVARLLKENKPGEAVDLMKAELDKLPGDPLVAYNCALTLYQAGKLEEALAAFQKLTTSPAGGELQAKILFQLGNLQFRIGERQNNSPAAALAMERSLSTYDELLEKRPSAAVRKNREAARTALTEILDAIATGRLKEADAMVARNDTARLSRTLREAVEAQERLATLAPSEQRKAQLVTTRQRLADSLLADAARHSAETDQIASANRKEDDRKVLMRREQALEILDQARNQVPDDKRVADAIKEEKSKMADLITRRAAEYLDPTLAKPKLEGGDLDKLERGRRDLAPAVEMDPANTRAAKLKADSEARLEAEYLAQAEAAAAGIQTKNEPRRNLALATSAVDLFHKTLDVNPGNERAKEGLARVEALLPELHAQVAALDLAEAKKLLGQENSKPPQDNLKKAVGYLETSTQNFSRSLAMKAGAEEAQKGYDEARQLLSDSRDQLDEERQSRREADNQQAAAGKPADTKMYQQNQKQAPATSSGGFWNRSLRDW